MAPAKMWIYCGNESQFVLTLILTPIHRD